MPVAKMSATEDDESMLTLLKKCCFMCGKLASRKGSDVEKLLRLLHRGAEESEDAYTDYSEQQ
ncbi:unnamed protein product [Caretta caretta]